MWGDMTMPPACLASVRAKGAEGDVCNCEKLEEDINKGSEAVEAAEARAGTRHVVEAGALGYRWIKDMAEKGPGVLQLSEDAMGSVSPEAVSRPSQRSGKGVRLACCETGSGRLQLLSAPC